jgi:CubicO group peptidase (beta-lactamase class C family)
MIRKKLVGFVIALTCSLAASAVPPNPASTPASAQRMDQVAKFYVDTGQFMGAVLVARGDQVLFSKAYGSADIEWDLPNTVDTKFRIGSVTKQFTAAAILLLEQRGKLKLEDPIKKHYAEAPAAWDAITLHHLLTHTSGIPNFTSFPDYTNFEPLPTTPADVIKRFRDKPLEFTPGAEMRYSNSGYVLLGVVIEKAGGMGYAQFLAENLFTPLGMKDSGYESNSALLPKRAAGYTPGPNGIGNASYVHMSVPFSAGALYSTVGDLHRWTRSLFTHQVISAESLQKMLTPAKNDYALGIFVGSNLVGRLAQHGGGINGFNSQLSYYPESEVTIVALSNLNGGGAAAIADQLGKVVHGHAIVLPSERQTVKVPRATLEKYVGTYQLQPGFDLWFRVEGEDLVVHATGQPRMPLAAESPTRFFPLPIQAEFEFQVDANGKVTGVRLRQGGRDSLAPRTSDAVPSN